MSRGLQRALARFCSADDGDKALSCLTAAHLRSFSLGELLHLSIAEFHNHCLHLLCRKLTYIYTYVYIYTTSVIERECESERV